MTTPDDEALMAYADGELDPLATKRIERAIAADPVLAEKVAAHRALRARIGAAFAPLVEEAVPDRFATMLASTVVPLPTRQARPARSRWMQAAAMAACLVLGVTVGAQWQSGPVAVDGRGLAASGALAAALDRQLGGDKGDTRVLASFRAHDGAYCRVFAASAVDGIACRDHGSWALRHTQAPVRGQRAEYRQAGSADAALMAQAQDMMAGDPLDSAAERRARDAGWR